MNKNQSENRTNKLVGLLFVLAIHGGLAYLAMSYKLIPPPQEAVTLMVNLINPPKKEEPPPPPEPPKPEPPKEVKLVKKVPVERPKPTPKPVLVAEAPVVAPAEPVAPPAPPEPVKEEPPAPEPAPAPEPVKESQKPAEPVKLGANDLECSVKSEPNYPPASRRMGEQGSVKLRIELDDTGKITSVKVAHSSGHSRLDNAGISAVKNWRCNAATRDGKPASAIAIQTFDFILEGN